MWQGGQADGLQKLQNTSFSSEMWRDRLFPRILSSHLMLNSIQGERKLMLTILAAVSKSNSQNNFSARTSSPHFWIWLEEMAPCYKEESRWIIFMQIFWTTCWTILVLLSAREFLSTTSLRLKPIIPCQRLKLNLWSKAVCLQEQILTHQ